jgi:hypothetical protein
MIEIMEKIGYFIETYGFSLIICLLIILGLYVRIKEIINGNIVEWLVDKVGDAEAYFGSETGQLKLRSVYNAFVLQRPILAFFISFNTFSVLVDSALEKFEDMIENNEKIKEWYENKKKEIEENTDDVNIKDTEEIDIEESISDEHTEDKTVVIPPEYNEEYAEEILPIIKVENITSGVDKKIIEKLTSKKSEKIKKSAIETIWYEKKEKEIIESDLNSFEVYETTIEEIKKK